MPVFWDFLVKQPLPYLSIKRVFLQLVDTLELVGVALCHNQTVLLSVEEFSLIKKIKSASSEVPFPVDVDIGAPLDAAAKSVVVSCWSVLR